MSNTKVAPKRERTFPEPTTFDLSDGRAPYSMSGLQSAFRRCRMAAGAPDIIKAMDLRAGAVTEVRDLGADPFDLRDMATHADVITTNRYVRDTSAANSKVIKIRNDR